MGGRNFGNILPINVPKCHREKNHVFSLEKLHSSQFYYLQPTVYPSITDVVEGMNNLIQVGTITAKTAWQLKCFEERKKLKFTWRIKDLVLHSLVRTWDTFSVAMLSQRSRSDFDRKITSQTRVGLQTTAQKLLS